jgi:hypothetical protein
MRLVNMTVLYALLDVAAFIWLPRMAAYACVAGSVVLVVLMAMVASRESRRASDRLAQSRDNWNLRSFGA